MQVALGAVYAWSAFRIPLSENYGAMASAVNTTTEAYVTGMFLAGLMLVSSIVLHCSAARPRGGRGRSPGGGPGISYRRLRGGSIWPHAEDRNLENPSTDRGVLWVNDAPRSTHTYERFAIFISIHAVDQI